MMCKGGVPGVICLNQKETVRKHHVVLEGRITGNRTASELGHNVRDTVIKCDICSI